MQDVKAVLQDKIADALHDLGMDCRIADDAFFADLFPAGFKLRLDQTDRLGVFSHQLARYGQDELQRDEGHVHREEADLVRHLFARDLAHVGAFEVDDALVRAQLPCELSVADVDRVDLRGAVLQHTIRKAAGGSADIHAGFAGEVEAEIGDRLFELQAAAADIGQRVAAYLDGGVFVVGSAAFVRLLVVDVDLTCHDDRLCLFTALGKALFIYQNIQSFFHVCNSFLTMLTMPSVSSRSMCSASLTVICLTKRSAMARIW